MNKELKTNQKVCVRCRYIFVDGNHSKKKRDDVSNWFVCSWLKETLETNQDLLI